MAYAEEQKPWPGDIRNGWDVRMHHEMKHLLGRPWPLQSAGTIFKVPPYLRCCKPDAYEPVVISLGPYHRNPEKPMDFLKAGYEQKLLSRIPSQTEWDLPKQVYERVPDVGDRVRMCYLDPDDMDSNKPLNMDPAKLVRILIEDACFVVEFLFELAAWRKGSSGDGCVPPEIASTWHRDSIIMDMLLLENQIPFFILREVLNIALGTEVDHTRSPSPFLYLFDGYWPIPPSLFPLLSEGSSAASVGDPYHLLDLFRRTILPHLRFPIDERNESLRLSSWTTIRQATRLERAGVVFQSFYGDAAACSLSFHDGTMKMPPLAIGINTGNLFRNLVAFEQCHPASGYDVTSYAMLMHFLVRSEEDVDLSRRSGILNNSLGNNDAAREFFRDLSEVARLQYNKGKLYMNVAAYCRHSFGITRYWKSRAQGIRHQN